MHRFAFLVIVLLPLVASAHQPRLVETIRALVPDPEISKAYYGELTGEPHIFIIESPKEFALYANILAPMLPGIEPDVSLVIEGNGAEIVRLSADERQWEAYREEFAGDYYWRGQAYAAQSPPGTYTLRVSSPKNDSRYALAIGEIEVFDGPEVLNVLSLMPGLKRDFFETHPATFAISIGGAAILVLLFVIAFVIAVFLRYILRRMNRRRGCPSAQVIGMRGRLLRLMVATLILVVAIMTTWNPLLILLAGFVLAEALLGWCVLCALFGKGTCPV